MKAINRLLLAAVASGGLALSAYGQQASITLRNSDVAFCNAQSTSWTLKTLDTSPLGSDYQFATSSGSLTQYVSDANNVLQPVAPWIGGNHATVTLNDTIKWDVTVTKTLGAKTITVGGFVAVQNTGSAPASIGNIVVNLQRQKTYNKKSYWVSAAANVADATNGDAATSATIVSAGSQEDATVNAGVNGPDLNSDPNYTVNNTLGSGTFFETAGSGSLEFTDADNSTVFAINNPKMSIAPGQVVRLLYKATFNNDALKLADGTSLRVEVIITFGNAGQRGGGGATGKNIDIDGTPGLSADEANVRSVPTRITKNLPTMEICNDSLTLTTALLAVGNQIDGPNSYTLDPFSYNGNPWGTGSVTVAGTGGGLFAPLSTVLNPVYISDPVVLASGAVNASGTATFSGTLSAASSDLVGIAGAAILSGSTSDSVFVNVTSYDSNGNLITDPLTGQPVTVPYEIVCCSKFEHDLTTVAWPTYTPPPPPRISHTTYTKGGYGTKKPGEAPGVPDQLFASSYIAKFPSGLTIGISDAAGPRHDASWTANGTGQSALALYLTSAAGGPSAALSKDTINATSTSGGNLSRQTATLALNVAFSADGFGNVVIDYLVANSEIKGWTLTAAQASALNGKPVSQVLADANNALGGNGLPGYVGSFSNLNELVTALNESYDNGVPSDFAGLYLREP